MAQNPILTVQDASPRVRAYCAEFAKAPGPEVSGLIEALDEPLVGQRHNVATLALAVKLGMMAARTFNAGDADALEALKVVIAAAWHEALDMAAEQQAAGHA